VRGSAQNSAIKVGLIGAGSRGTYTGSAIAKNPRVKITAICDVGEEQIAKAKNRIGAEDAKGYKNFQDVLASDVDAVMIATPVYLHPDHFEAAVKSESTSTEKTRLTWRAARDEGRQPIARSTSPSASNSAMRVM
jgi:prephenate dehydrogenase